MRKNNKNKELYEMYSQLLNDGYKPKEIAEVYHNYDSKNYLGYASILKIAKEQFESGNMIFNNSFAPTHYDVLKNNKIKIHYINGTKKIFEKTSSKVSNINYYIQQTANMFAEENKNTTLTQPAIGYVLKNKLFNNPNRVIHLNELYKLAQTNEFAHAILVNDGFKYHDFNRFIQLPTSEAIAITKRISNYLNIKKEDRPNYIDIKTYLESLIKSNKLRSLEIELINETISIIIKEIELIFELIHLDLDKEEFDLKFLHTLMGDLAVKRNAIEKTNVNISTEMKCAVFDLYVKEEKYLKELEIHTEINDEINELLYLKNSLYFNIENLNHYCGYMGKIK